MKCFRVFLQLLVFCSTYSDLKTICCSNVRKAVNTHYMLWLINPTPFSLKAEFFDPLHSGQSKVTKGA